LLPLGVATLGPIKGFPQEVFCCLLFTIIINREDRARNMKRRRQQQSNSSAKVAAGVGTTMVTAEVVIRGQLKRSRERPGQKQQGTEVAETTRDWQK
jgi:hypothetical protein